MICPVHRVGTFSQVRISRYDHVCYDSVFAANKGQIGPNRALGALLLAPLLVALILAPFCTDISTFAWVSAAPWAGLDLDEFPSVKNWMEKIAARPAVKEGMDVPEPNALKELMNDPEKMKQFIADAQAMMVKMK
jgi:hypothetical protein